MRNKFDIIGLEIKKSVVKENVFRAKRKGSCGES